MRRFGEEGRGVGVGSGWSSGRSAGVDGVPECSEAEMEVVGVGIGTGTAVEDARRI